MNDEGFFRELVLESAFIWIVTGWVFTEFYFDDLGLAVFIVLILVTIVPASFVIASVTSLCLGRISNFKRGFRSWRMDE